jgi:hypothetical protein
MAQLHQTSSGSATFDGNVGIGTNPQATLHVKSDSVGIPAPGVAGSMQVGDGNGFGLMLGCNGSGVGYIQPQRNNGTTTTFDLLLSPNGGNVGIGTDDPSSLLHLAANAPYITFEDKDNNQDWQLRATTWFALKNKTSNSELLRVNPTGDVGIGTTNPQAKLHVKGGTSSTGAVDTNKQLVLSVTDNPSYQGTLSWGKKVGDSVYYALALDAVTNDTASDILLAPSGGNVGIGTDDPQATLDVNGKARSTSTVVGDVGTTLATKDYVDANGGGGVSSIIAGAGIAVNQSTGDVTITNTGGGGGGGETKADIYGTAKAWGNIEADGTLGTNYKVVSSTRTATGVYTVIWDNPSSSDYVVNLSPLSVSANTGITIISPTEFQIISRSTTTPDNGADSPTTFAIFDNEPAEIIVGSGTVANTNLYGTAKAWGDVATDGTLTNGLGCSVTRTQAGYYTVTFNTPRTDNDYSVVTAPVGGFAGFSIAPQNYTNTGFQIRCLNNVAATTTWADAAFNFAPYSTKNQQR